jgi:hypothetical protein
VRTVSVSMYKMESNVKLLLISGNGKENEEFNGK